MGLLRKLAVEQEAAIIAVTHDEKIFDQFDRICQFRDGRFVRGDTAPPPVALTGRDG